MNNRVLKNYVFNLLYQVLIVVTPLITTPYISRVIGAEGIGLYGSSYGVAMVFTTCGMLGIANYGSKRIAQVQDDKEKYSSVFWSIWIIQLIASLLSVFAYLVVSFAYKDNTTYLLLLLPLVLSSALDISWLYMGLEDLKKTVIRNIIVKLLFVISLFIFVKSEEDLMIYFLIQSSSYLLGYIVLWFSVRKTISFTSIKNLNLSSHIKEIFILFIPVIAIQLTASFDRTIIKFFSNDVETGFYDQAIKISRIVTPFLTSLSYALLPKIANLAVNNEKDKINEGIKLSFDFTFFFGLLGAGLIFIITPIFVPLFFGEEFTCITDMVKLACVLIIVIPVGGVFANQLAVPLGKNKHYTIPVYITVIVDFALIILLVPKFGAMGGMIAIVAAEAITCIVRIIVMYKTISLKFIFSKSYKYIIIFLLTFGISLAFYLGLVGKINDIILMCITCMIYGFTLLIFTMILRPYLYTFVLENLKKILIKKHKTIE